MMRMGQPALQEELGGETAMNLRRLRRKWSRMSPGTHRAIGNTIVGLLVLATVVAAAYTFLS